MTIFLISFLVMALAVLAMALGVMLTGRPIKGSCGGLNNLQGLDNCPVCGRQDPCETTRGNNDAVIDTRQRLHGREPGEL